MKKFVLTLSMLAGFFADDRAAWAQTCKICAEHVRPA
jgi:hypothetical protein